MRVNGGAEVVIDGTGECDGDGDGDEDENLNGARRKGNAAWATLCG